MIVRPLPGTDLEVSAIGLGCWALGGEHWGDDVDDARSAAAVHAALDVGITLFDTAPLYGWGHADEVLVAALGSRRHDVVIATKVGAGRGPDGHARSDLRPAHLEQDAEASLQRLALDHIDLLQVHWPCDLGTPLADTVGALEELKRRGLIRHWGLCNYGVEDLGVSPATLQTPYSMLRREAEAELLPACRAAGIGVLAYEPLCRGLLTGKFRSPPSFPDSDLRSRDDRFTGARFLRAASFVATLERAAVKLGVPTAALALAWAARQPGVSAVLAGARSPEQVRGNAQAAELLGRRVRWDVIDRVAGLWRG